MKTQRGFDWYLMVVIVLLMLWSTVPIYISYWLRHG
jgi:hypothetical protein